MNLVSSCVGPGSSRRIAFRMNSSSNSSSDADNDREPTSDSLSFVSRPISTASSLCKFSESVTPSLSFEDLGVGKVPIINRVFVGGSVLCMLSNSWSPSDTIRVSSITNVFLFSDLLVCENNESMREIVLDAFCVCEIVSDCSAVGKTRPLLRVGLPRNLSFAVFGDFPVVLEFSSFVSMGLWKLALDEILQHCKESLPDHIPVAPSRNWIGGYLYKLKIGHGLGVFKKRYCVVKNNMFTYYSGVDDFVDNRAPIGHFSLHSCFINFAETEKYRYTCFTITCPQKNCVYVFGSEVPRNIMNWCDFFRDSSLFGLQSRLYRELAEFHDANERLATSK